MPQLKNSHQLERRAATVEISTNMAREQGYVLLSCPRRPHTVAQRDLGRKAILFHCFAGCSKGRHCNDGSPGHFTAASSLMVLALGPLIGKIRGDFSPNARRACGNRLRRSPTVPGRYQHSAVSSAHLTSSVTWNVRRLDHAGCPISPRHVGGSHD